MRFSHTLVVVAAVSFPAIAAADASRSITGDPAKSLMRALKVAGVKSTGTAAKPAWKIAELFCQAKETDDKLGAVSCTADTQKLSDAPAVAVQQALVAAGAPEKYGMGGSRTNAYNLACTGDQSAFTCTFATEPPKMSRLDG